MILIRISTLYLGQKEREKTLLQGIQLANVLKIAQVQKRQMTRE